MCIDISFSKLNCISHCISRPISAQSSFFPLISVLIVSLSPYQRAHPGVSLAAPWLLPGLPHCSLASMAAPWLLLAVRLCLFLAAPGCPWMLPGHATLLRWSCGEAVLCQRLAKRSSAAAAICRSGGLQKHAPAQWVLDGDRTSEIRLRVVCKLPCRSGTSARGGNKKRDSVFSCPLQCTHGYQLKPSATHISNTTTALQSDTSRPCTCRKLGK